MSKSILVQLSPNFPSTTRAEFGVLLDKEVLVLKIPADIRLVPPVPPTEPSLKAAYDLVAFPALGNFV